MGVTKKDGSNDDVDDEAEDFLPDAEEDRLDDDPASADGCPPLCDCDSAPTPDNDTCGDAAPVGLSGPAVTIHATTCGAADDTTGSCSPGAGSSDVYYGLEVLMRSSVVIDTVGSAWDTVLILTGDECPGTEIMCSAEVGGDSRLSTTLGSGTYRIVVDGEGPESGGPFTLNVGVSPVNDDCSGAVDIGAASTVAGDTAQASDDPGGACTGASTRGVWYTFSLSLEEAVYLDTLDGAGWDSVVSVRQGTCDGPVVMCLNDGCGGERSQGASVLEPGTYFVLVSGGDGDGFGPFTLRFLHSPCPGAKPLSVGTNAGNTESAANDMSASCGGDTGRDAAYHLALCPGEHEAHFDLCDGRSWNTVLYVRSGGGGLCGGAEVACDDDSCSGARSQRSMLSTNLSGPGLFFFIVDGKTEANNGEFVLSADF